jgi:hypothetical protein
MNATKLNNAINARRALDAWENRSDAPMPEPSRVPIQAALPAATRVKGER